MHVKKHLEDNLEILQLTIPLHSAIPKKNLWFLDKFISAVKSMSPLVQI